HANSIGEAVRTLAELSITLQPTLLLSLLLFYAINPILEKIPYVWGAALVIVSELLLTSCVYSVGAAMFGAESMPPLARTSLLTVIVVLILLGYFHLRHRALTPAIAEARLQALQARIRPHFLFNSINAVLSILRSDPKRAETALEDMADLFRVLMADNRDLVPLAKELALSRQYLALEKLRLEDRLTISWQIDNIPPDALMPPLVLQPLLENAVYHGIEPMPEGGTITINIYANHKEVHLILSNPYTAQGSHHAGNKMALGNIRERLTLHFDVEASLTSKVSANNYEVHIVIPYHREQ
ncbi:MAG TPA: histidine kinase, partial [Nitrosospira sp.]